MGGWPQLGLPLAVRSRTRGHDPLRDADEPPAQHVLIEMCRLAGIQGPVELRPYLFPTREEFAAGKLNESQVVMQSSSLLPMANSMRNREWFPHRFQEVCSELRADVQVIQLGSRDDPKLEGATDLRGKTTIRESAAILANSYVFIGLVGFLMHLARAVDCRSVIIYGGREKPAQTGYVANKNLYTQVKCAPCWLRNPCDYDRKCLDMVTLRLCYRRHCRADQPLRLVARSPDRPALNHPLRLAAADGFLQISSQWHPPLPPEYAGSSQCAGHWLKSFSNNSSYRRRKFPNGARAISGIGRPEGHGRFAILK